MFLGHRHGHGGGPGVPCRRVSNGFMTQLGPGRPRLAPHRPQGHTPRAEILDAAAELFTTNGSGNTATRAIAEAVLRVLGWTGDLAAVGASAENLVHTVRV